MNKKKNNKGFSLVELIVVIAVMAVLVVVLAPAYLRYVDKAKVQKDVSAVSEVVQAITVAASEEAVASEIPTLSGTVTAPLSLKIVDTATGATISAVDANADADSILKEINATVGKLDLTSNTLGGKTIEITVSKNANHNLTIQVAPTGSTITDVDTKSDAYSALQKLSK